MHVSTHTLLKIALKLQDTDNKDDKEGLQTPLPSAGGGGELRAHLSALLDDFDRISEAPRQLDATERQLLAALEQRIRGQARLQLEPAGGSLSLVAPQSGEQAAVVGGQQGQLDQMQQQHQHQRTAAPGSSRADTMRYSTPNLLLSSNFELLLRQQDRVSDHDKCLL